MAMRHQARTARPLAVLREGRNDWYKMRNLAGGAAEVLVYDEIGFFGVTADDFIRDLRGLTATEISLRINSPGGEIFDGIAIHNALRSHGAKITAYVDSLAASIASVIAMAGDHVVMMPHSQMMIHDGSGLAIGNADDMREMAELLDRQSDNIAGVYAERAGGTPDEWRKRMRAETWMTAAEAVELGLADEVANPPRRREEEPEESKPEEMHASWDLSIFRYAGRDKAPAPAMATVVDKAKAVHHTGTEGSSWDGPGAVANMPEDSEVLAYCHAWADPDGDSNAKSSYKFPHHKTKGGPANLAACRNGLARLDSADIPEGDRDGVRAHLQAHLDDAEKGEKPTDVTAPPISPGKGKPPESKAPRFVPEEDEPDKDEPGEEQPEDKAASPPPDEDDPDEDEEEDGDGPSGPLALATDSWSGLVAHLTTPALGDWRSLVAHLISPMPSRAATA